MGRKASDNTVRENELKVMEMYSELRYPRLDPEYKNIYERHRSLVYQKMGVDASIFFRGKLVLDAGCGTGEETLFLASKGPEKVVGIDTSAGSLEYARRSATQANIKNVEFKNSSVLDETIFPSESFDYVSSLGCIHHTPSTRMAFNNLCRMVKPGGFLCTFIYNKYGHFLYNVECSVLDYVCGNDIEKRIWLARRLFDWRRNTEFYREGVASTHEARIYDKYGVLFRDSVSLNTLLAWYAEEGFSHVGSFPMYLMDMLDGLKCRSSEGEFPRSARGYLAKVLSSVAGRSDRRAWTFRRRFNMQTLLLLIGLYDYGSSFRILQQKAGEKDGALG